MKLSPTRYGKTCVVAAVVGFAISGWAADTTAPRLTAPHTWIQKESGFFRFNLLLDPQDDVGIERLEVREKINATTIPANVPWREAVQNGIGSSEVPWKPEEPLKLEFNCTSMVLQVRAVDTSGNYSEVITRTYKSPFPLSPALNLTPTFSSPALNFTGSALDCRGLFNADFDGNGRDDLLILDRTTGVVNIRRQNLDGTFSSNGFNLTAGSITDGAVADFNGDGRPDIVVVVDDTVKVYENQGADHNNVLQFQSNIPGGVASSGMSVVRHVAVADLTGEGKPEIIISGVGDGNLGGSDANVAVLLNNSQFSLSAANNAVAPGGSSAGRMVTVDFDADGDLDLAMLDAAQKQILLFKNRGNSSFGAANEVDVTLRPVALKVGPSAPTSADSNPSLPLAPRAIAVGDVTGDGRPDLIVTMHAYLGTGSPPDIVYRNMELWQLLENRGGGDFHRWPDQIVSQSGPAGTELDFSSDVILQDLNQDRLPELVFTSQFGNGLKTVRFMPWLNRQNEVHSFTTSFVEVGSAASPHRLAAARFGANNKKDIVVANGDANQLSWWFAMSNIASDKTVDVVGGASTSSDPIGIEGSNGIRSYAEYAGGSVHYSLTYINNGTSVITGAVLECALPAGLLLLSADSGYSSQTSGGTVYVRWTVDIPAGASGVKKLSALLNSIKAPATFAPKNTLKQGTKTLASSTMPVVKVVASDFSVIPTSFYQPWSFSFKPLNAPPVGASMWVQGSFNGTNWFFLNASSMTRSVPLALEWRLVTTSVPVGCRYFRTAIMTTGFETGYSSVFSTFLPATTGLKIVTKSPPKTGNTWTFSATQTSTAANLTVRFQSTETPASEGSWTDLPVHVATTRAGNGWTSNTYNIPSGSRYFRAISAAPGWVDSISAQAGPYTVQATPPSLPPFTYWHISGVTPAQGSDSEYAHQGDTVTFMATTASVPGIQVRFQSKLHSDLNESSWADLPEGSMQVAGTKWTFTSRYLPVGFRDFRAISFAPGYTNNTTLIHNGVFFSTVFAFLVKEPRVPQIPTMFGDFEAPANDSLHRTGINVPVTLKLFDFNSVKRAYVQVANPGGTFKEVVGTNMTNAPATADWSTALNFSGTGQLILRVAVVDNFIPSQTCYSSEVTITVGPGNGGASGPSIGAFANTFTQATLNSRGSVKVKVRIGDDSQVRYAFLHRMTAGGLYHSTVGEMTRAAVSNPSDFTCTDANLSDGTYYYRVVAHDYDGNESISGTTVAYVVATPAPPPAPIHLDIAPESRLVTPTFPTTKFNYVYLPQTTSGMVDFSFSGLPAGTNRLVAYRTDLGPNQPYWEQTVTKTSGSLKIKAPWWKDSKVNPNTGEGEYRIVCFKGSTQIAHGSGVNTFTVGHAWQTPDTFKTLDWGLYWFKNGNNGLRGISSTQDDDYFDPDKPTVIYVHGWQPGEVKVGRRESWMRQDPYKDATYVDCCKIWKNQGYNVGIFNWNQFGDGDLLFSQANIYYVATEDGLPDGHSMIYSLRNSDGSSSRHYLPSGEGGDIEGRTVVDLFLDELLRCMEGYSPSANKEFRMIGHSLGTQVVGRTCDAIRKNPGWGIPLPTRICLLEIAQINGLSINGLDIPDIQTGYITGLVGADVALECYQSTDLQSLLGVNLAWVGNIHNMSAYTRWRPDFIQPIKVGLDVFQKSHNEIVRWYMQSFEYNEFPGFTYWAPFVKRDAVDNATSASTDTSRIKGLMGGQYFYEQSEGKNSASITDDQYERKNR